MANVEEQNDSCLERNEERLTRRRLPIGQMWRRFLRRSVAFGMLCLARIDNNLNEDNDSSYQQHRRGPTVTLATIDTKISETILNNDNEDNDVVNYGQNPADNLLSEEITGSYTVDNRVLPDFIMKTISTTDSLPINSISTPVTSDPTTSTLSLSNSNSSMLRSPFRTDSPFQIALSYSGKTEGRVRRIKKQTQNHPKVNVPFSIFFAPDFQDELAQIDGMRILERIYREAQLVVVFLSKAYPESDFCYGEWRIISDRFFGGQKVEQQKKRLLLIRLTEGNFEYLGLVKNDFYIDGTKKSNKQISINIVNRFEGVSKLPVQ